MQKISVVMPVYNASKHLCDSISSILNQSYENFEFIIIDDGSNDDSVKIINSYKDSRIFLIKNNKNIGISESLNIGIQYAKYPLILRMDSDDISAPERFQLQVQYMNSNPQIAISGTSTKIIDEYGQICSLRNCKLGDQKIKIALFCGETSIAHPSAIIRKDFLQKHKLYYCPNYDYAEDYDLWCRCSLLTKFDNLPDHLVYYRIHSNSISAIFNKAQRISARHTLMRYLALLKIPYTDREIECHFQFSLPINEPLFTDFIERIKNWKDKIIRLNNKHKWFDENLFQEEIQKRYEKVLVRSFG